jgi:hypothetical protein
VLPLPAFEESGTGEGWGEGRRAGHESSTLCGATPDHPTVITPLIEEGCTSHWYRYEPGAVNVLEKLPPVVTSLAGPSSNATLWAPLQLHETVPPTASDWFPPPWLPPVNRGVPAGVTPMLALIGPDGTGVGVGGTGVAVGGTGVGGTRVGVLVAACAVGTAVAPAAVAVSVAVTTVCGTLVTIRVSDPVAVADPCAVALAPTLADAPGDAVVAAACVFATAGESSPPQAPSPATVSAQHPTSAPVRTNLPIIAPVIPASVTFRIQA